MKTSLILLLILNLYSCGKAPQSKEINSRFTNDRDIDGDFLDNQVDPNPYFADIPHKKLEIKLSTPNPRDAQFTVKPSYIKHKALASTLKSNFSQELIPLKTFLSTYTLTTKLNSEDKKIILKQKIDTADQIYNPSLIYENDLGEKMILSEQSKTEAVSSDFFNSEVRIKVHNYIFERNQNLIEYKTLIENMKDRTFKLRIHRDETFIEHYITTKISLKEALQKLDPFAEFGSEGKLKLFKQKRSCFTTFKIKNCNSQDGFWFFLNKETQNADRSISTGEIVDLIYLSKSQYYSNIPWDYKKELKLLSQSHAEEVVFPAKVALKISGAFNIVKPQKYTKKDFYMVQRGPSHEGNEEKVSCRIKKVRELKTVVVLTSINIDKYFDIYVNDEKMEYQFAVNFLENIGEKNLEETRIEVEYKEDIKKNFLIGSFSHNCKKKVKMKKKTVKRFQGIQVDISIKSINRLN